MDRFSDDLYFHEYHDFLNISIEVTMTFTLVEPLRISILEKINIIVVKIR